MQTILAFTRPLRLLAVGATFSMLLSSCGPTLSPFTQALYEDYNWPESELKRIQFYLSDDIVLRREIGGGSSSISEGRIRVVDGRQVAEVIIRRGTPGVFLFSPRENRFAVSFEDSGNERYLVFGPNPRFGDRYVLLATDWDRNSGTVTYDGRQWQVGSRAAYASLMVNLKRLRETDINSRQATGRRVN